VNKSTVTSSQAVGAVEKSPHAYKSSLLFRSQSSFATSCLSGEWKKQT